MFYLIESPYVGDYTIKEILHHWRKKIRNKKKYEYENVYLIEDEVYKL